MNKVIEIGRLTKDPELRYTQNNTPVCGFTLAVDRFAKAGEEKQADFFPVVAWNKTAEFCNKYFSKGRKVVVFGRLQTRNWDDDQGVKHYVTEIVADEVDFADSKKDGEAGGQANPQAGQQAEGQAAAPAGNQQQESKDNPPAQGQAEGQAAAATKKPKPWEVQKTNE